jgi:hypothetical protein
MLLIEAGFGVASVVVYVLIASVWRPAAKVGLQPIAAAA